MSFRSMNCREGQKAPRGTGEAKRGTVEQRRSLARRACHV